MFHVIYSDSPVQANAFCVGLLAPRRKDFCEIESLISSEQRLRYAYINHTIESTYHLG